MKVSKSVSIDFELFKRVIEKENNFSKAVAEALEDWIAKKKGVKEKTTISSE